MEELKCDMCGKTGFKSKAGLAGHKKISHGIDTRKTVPDDIGKNLNALSESLEILSILFFRAMKGFVQEEKLEKLMEKYFKEYDPKYKPVLKALKNSIREHEAVESH